MGRKAELRISKSRSLGEECRSSCRNILLSQLAASLLQAAHLSIYYLPYQDILAY